ncbi:forkhead box protein (AaegFOXN1) [Anopheles darlingi]|uniref:Forkhead box protein (AaegFOXN1) n=2 Tax=Anopheles darlingi TaxID=43151 RepID=W5JS45_ANODA|nr:forkhead box protein (AaegFOXN1) [Anopheles darlingi]
MVEPQFRPNLIQALSRSPFHASSGIDKATYKSMQQQRSSANASPTGNGTHYSKQDNFPQLASRLAPGDAQNGVLHGEDLDDLSRSSTPIDYDASDLSTTGHHQHHNNHYHQQQQQQQQQQQHHHQTQQQHPVHHVQQAQQPVQSPHPLIRGVLVSGTQNGGGEGCAYLSNEDAPLPAGTTTAIVQCPTELVYVNGTGGLPKEIAGREWSAETIEDVNAATAMLALKHGPKIFIENSFRNGTPPVITTSPSEDHTYSAGGASGAGEQSATALVSNGGSPLLIGNGSSCCSSSDERYDHSRNHQLQRHAPLLTHHPLHHHQHHSNQHHSDNLSNGTSSDAAYESSEESHHPHHASAEDMEERRRQEGVFALLNLAQMTYSSSPSSSMSSSTSTLSSPASSNGSLKRSAPNDLYSGTPTGYYHNHHNHHHHNRQQLVASPDERTMRIANGTGTPPPHHPHNIGPEYGGPAPPSLPGTGTTVTPYYGGVLHAASKASDDLLVGAQRYTSPPPAKKTKARTPLKKLKKKSWPR